MSNVALVVGASGITGSNLAEKLIAEGWVTYGLARNPNTDIAGLHPVQADLLDVNSLKKHCQVFLLRMCLLRPGCERTPKRRILNSIA